MSLFHNMSLKIASEVAYRIIMEFPTIFNAKLKALKHYTRNCKRNVVIIQSHHNFFSQPQQFFQQFYISATIFTTKIVVKIFEVSKGLKDGGNQRATRVKST